MAIPTEQEFKDFLNLLNDARGYFFLNPRFTSKLEDYMNVDFINNIDNPSPFDILLSELSISSLEFFLSELHRHIEDTDTLRTKHPVQLWLNSNENFSLATWGVFTGSLDRFNKIEFIKRCKEQTLSILNFDPTTQLLSFDSIEQLENFENLVVFEFEYVEHHFLLNIVTYLYVYFYHPDYHSLSRAETLPSSDTLGEMKKALRLSTDLLDCLSSSHNRLPEVRNKNALISKLEELNEELAVTLAGLDNRFSPVKVRNDRAKDRELIYCLWRQYHLVNGQRGVTNILRLMSLEGIESSYDEREIHKLIKTWELEHQQYENRRKSLANDYPETQFAKNLGETYWW